MKKFAKFIVLGISMVLLFGCLVACSKEEDPLKIIQEVKPEVSYGYTAIGEYDITIDLNAYNYKSLATKLVENKEEYNHPYGQQLVGDYLYYFYQYNSRGSVKKYNNYIGAEMLNAPLSVNEKTFDVGLFRVNINTAECELVYDFKQVNATSVNETKNPYLGEVIDENVAVFQYNGTINVFDLKEKDIAFTFDAYDKETFKSADRFTYYFNNFGDYVMLSGNVLKYFELDGLSFDFHGFVFNSSTLAAERLLNYLRVYDYVNLKDYYYDLTDDSEVSAETVAEALRKVQQPQTVEGAYTIGGKQYYLFFSADNYLSVFDENINKLCQLDEEFMKQNSQTFNDLYDLWTGNHYKYKPVNFWVENSKLFVGFNAEYSFGNRTPTYIYEYDIENNKLYYVGFSMSDLDVVLKLH